MAWQVGNACFDDKATAENVYFSKVVPVIGSDGSLKQLIYDGKNWELNGKDISAHLPECNPAQNYMQGFELMAALIPTALVLLFGKIIIDKLKQYV